LRSFRSLRWRLLFAPAEACGAGALLRVAVTLTTAGPCFFISSVKSGKPDARFWACTAGDAKNEEQQAVRRVRLKVIR
jgi:hypothetical protein